LLVKMNRLTSCAIAAFSAVAIAGCQPSSSPTPSSSPSAAVSRHPAPLPTALDGWHVFAQKENVQFRVYGRSGTTIPGYIVTMNGCDSWRGTVRWRTTGSQQVRYQVAYSAQMVQPGKYLGPAADGYSDIGGCAQLIFFTNADNQLVDIVADWAVWTPTV
jgi:hypothetical protein